MTNREGLTAVITGASSGFGRGVAERLAGEGANVVLAARRTHLIEALAEQLGPNALAVTADVSKEEDISRLLGEAVGRFGKVDVWINNAAVGLIGTYDEVPAEDLIREVEINVIGTLYGSYYAIRYFQDQGAGTLINVGSVSSQVPFPYYTPYSSTKYAVTGLTDALHEEMKLEGWNDIHVCTVHPWATDTPWFIHTANYTGHKAQIQPMDDPEPVIDAIIGLIDKPEKSVGVGMKTKGTSVSGALLPNLTEKMNAKQIQSNIQQAPPAPYTTGSLYEPMEEGTGVSGGIREQMERD